MTLWKIIRFEYEERKEEKEKQLKKKQETKEH